MDIMAVFDRKVRFGRVRLGTSKTTLLQHLLAATLYPTHFEGWGKKKNIYNLRTLALSTLLRTVFSFL